MGTATATATVPPVPQLVRGYEQVAEHYRQRIRDGELAPGEKLPGVRKIAKEWRTTATTVHRSMGLLRDEGWIAIEDRRAPVVIGVPAPKPPLPEPP